MFEFQPKILNNFIESLEYKKKKQKRFLMIKTSRNTNLINQINNISITKLFLDFL